MNSKYLAFSIGLFLLSFLSPPSLTAQLTKTKSVQRSKEELRMIGLERKAATSLLKQNRLDEALKKIVYLESYEKGTTIFYAGLRAELAIRQEDWSEALVQLRRKFIGEGNAIASSVGNYTAEVWWCFLEERFGSKRQADYAYDELKHKYFPQFELPMNSRKFNLEEIKTTRTIKMLLFLAEREMRFTNLIRVRFYLDTIKKIDPKFKIPVEYEQEYAMYTKDETELKSRDMRESMFVLFDPFVFQKSVKTKRKHN